MNRKQFTQRSSFLNAVSLTVIFVGLSLMIPSISSAHCDTMNGPVIKDAKIALEKKDVTPVLKWIKPEHENDIRAAFQKTLVVRAQSTEARELADMYFFETLVRLHRTGEGAAYTGIQPEETPIDPIVELADQALASGSATTLLKAVTDKITAGILERFERARTAQKQMNVSIELGREYVEAYVLFVHYVEEIHLAAAKPLAHGQQSGGEAQHGETEIQKHKH